MAELAGTDKSMVSGVFCMVSLCIHGFNARVGCRMESPSFDRIGFLVDGYGVFSVSGTGGKSDSSLSVSVHPDLHVFSGFAGIVYTAIVLAVTLIKKHSLYRAAFRTGYTILGLFGIQLFLSEVGTDWINQGGITMPFLATAGSVLVYETISKGVRDVIELIRPHPRRSRLWWANWQLESGAALLSLIYSLAYYGMLHEGRETDSLALLFFYAPLAAFAVLSNVIVRLARKEQKLKLLFVLATEINRNLDLRKVMEKTILPLSKVIPYNRGFFYLLKNGRLYPAVTAGEVPEHLKKWQPPLNQGISGWVAAHGVPAMIHHAGRDPRCLEDMEEMDEVCSVLSGPSQDGWGGAGGDHSVEDGTAGL